MYNCFGVLINDKPIALDYDDISKFILDYEKDIITIELTEGTCYNCKMDCVFVRDELIPAVFCKCWDSETERKLHRRF